MVARPSAQGTQAKREARSLGVRRADRNASVGRCAALDQRSTSPRHVLRRVEIKVTVDAGGVENPGAAILDGQEIRCWQFDSRTHFRFRMACQMIF
jgi:hypothetical protein